jgi:hypothetical protein
MKGWFFFGGEGGVSENESRRGKSLRANGKPQLWPQWFLSGILPYLAEVSDGVPIAPTLSALTREKGHTHGIVHQALVKVLELVIGDSGQQKLVWPALANLESDVPGTARISLQNTSFSRLQTNEINTMTISWRTTLCNNCVMPTCKLI